MISKTGKQLSMAALLALLAGCGDQTQGNPFGTQPEETGTGTGTGSDTLSEPDETTGTGTSSGSESVSESVSETSTEPDPGATFAGLWGEILSLPNKQTGIPVIKTQIALGRTYFLNTITSDGHGHLTISQKACKILTKLQDPINGLNVPDAFIEGLQPVVRHVTLTSDAPGTPFVSDDVYEIRGAKLKDPANDPLPGNGSGGKALPCDEAPYGSECDQDSDDKPGMTNVLSGLLSCRIYVTQKWHAQYSGKIVDNDHIAGPVVKNDSWQTVLDANPSFCNAPNTGTAPVIDKCPDLFYFKMVRLPAGSTCEDVMALTNCVDKPIACNGDDSYELNPGEDDYRECL